MNLCLLFVVYPYVKNFAGLKDAKLFYINSNRSPIVVVLAVVVCLT